jgi:hypothetical protein
MLPLLALLAIAIIKRIADYGITESRHLLIVLSVWLSFITVYFLIKGREYIRIIPISLFVFSVLIVFGPWSIRSVSLNSQSERLEKYIAQKPSVERNDEIRNLVRYLNDNYGSQSLQKFVKIDLQAIEEQKEKTFKEKGRWELQKEITDTVLTSLNVSNIATAQVWSNQQKNYINAEQGVFSVKGALQVVEISTNLNSGNDKKLAFSVEGEKFSLLVDSNNNLILSDIKNAKTIFNVNDLLKTLYKNKTLKADKDNPNPLAVANEVLTIQQITRYYIFKLRFEQLNAFYPDKTPFKPKNIYYAGYLIIYPNL